MRSIFLYTVCIALGSFFANGQPLRDINYKYLYQPESPIDFSMKVVRNGSGWTILYTLLLKDTTDAQRYTIEWEGREALSSKEGVVITPSVRQTGTSLRTAYFDLSRSEAPKILVARITNQASRKTWLYYSFLEPNYPVELSLMKDSLPVVSNFVRPGAANYHLTLSEPVIVSYYDNKFPSAAPAFSEAQGAVPRSIAPDSITRMEPGAPFQFYKNGLYLFQTDTTIARGYSIRAESDYPRYTIVQNLPGPLIYICTKNEYDRLEAAKGDKKAFDRTVLAITGDTERAKKLIRSYFRRVELANYYFTSYKEGWKTDRGMIYIIFGPPDEVYKFADREVWEYDNSVYQIGFDFVKSSSVFDPDNYVLIRDKKHKDVWYQVVDLWRNARF